MLFIAITGFYLIWFLCSLVSLDLFLISSDNVYYLMIFCGAFFISILLHVLYFSHYCLIFAYVCVLFPLINTRTQIRSIQWIRLYSIWACGYLSSSIIYNLSIFTGGSGSSWWCCNSSVAPGYYTDKHVSCLCLAWV